MRLTKLISAACFCLIASFMAHSAVPQIINYQGFLTDNSGNALDTTADVTFRIFDVVSGGAALWSETQSVTSTGGLFTVLLGSNTPIDETIINGTDRYLEVQLNASPFSPRTRLAASPYAIRIATIDGASGGTISGNLNLDTSSATAGNILKNGLPFIHNFGSANTFIGEYAGNLTMTGYSNSAIGQNVLPGNTTGNENTANGAFALQQNTSGSYNTASGAGALRNNSTGLYNTACGLNALYLNTSGGSNTACGANSLVNNTTSSNNTAHGVNVLLSNTTGNSNTASGLNALVNNTTGSSNTACGRLALASNTTGVSNTASGRSALSANTTGGNNTAIGFGADVSAGDLTNATAIGAGAIIDASNKIRLGNTAVTVIEGQVAYTFTSDKNQKENFQPVNGNEVLQKIRDLELSSWNYQGHDPKQFRHYGPMAQDFFAAFGNDDIGKIGTETTLNSGDVAGILMVAVQALGNENAELKARMDQMEKELRNLQAEKETP